MPWSGKYIDCNNADSFILHISGGGDGVSYFLLMSNHWKRIELNQLFNNLFKLFIRFVCIYPTSSLLAIIQWGKGFFF